MYRKGIPSQFSNFNKTGKKQLSDRIHNCQYCGYEKPTDVVSAKVIRNRGLVTVEQTVKENFCSS